MTALATATPTTEDRLRSVLRLDGVVTAAVGLLGLLGPSWYGGPSWLARAVGAAFVLAGVEAFLLGRAAGKRLWVGGYVIADLALLWTATATALALALDMDAAGREVLLLTAVGTLAFGVAEVRLLRRL